MANSTETKSYKRDALTWAWNPANEALSVTVRGSETPAATFECGKLSAAIKLAALGLGFQNKLRDATAADAGTSLAARIEMARECFAALSLGEWDRKRETLTPEQREEMRIAELVGVWNETKTSNGGKLSLDAYVARRIKNVVAAGGGEQTPRAVKLQMCASPVIAALVAAKKAAAIKTNVTFDDLE
jgi:hypothetical protein